MDIYDLDQLKQISEKQAYKFARLTDIDGNELVKFNNPQTSISERIEDIRTRLGSPAVKEGYYYFEAKNYIKGPKPDKYVLQKGTPKEAINLKPEPEPMSEKDSPLSFAQAIKLNKEIAELRARNEYLEKEADEWKIKYNELMSEVEEIIEQGEGEDEPAPGGDLLGENSEKFLSGLSDNLLPIFERHYDLKEKKLQIEEGKVIADLAKQGIDVTNVNGNGQHNGQQVPGPGPEQEDEWPPEDEPQEMSEEMTEEDYNSLVTTALLKLEQEDPERYKIVVQSANNGGDIVDLLQGGTGFEVDPEDMGTEPGE